MEQIDFGWLSLLPPIIAIILALFTKEVIASLLVGIVSGVLVYSGGNIISATETLFSLMSEKMFGTAKVIDGVSNISGNNAYILIFLALLGALAVVITMAGGSKAYGDWAVTKIKSRRGAALSTFGLGVLIFIDDYFNCLTVGTVMRPVTDKHKISREKLAYIIDSTAAPICIIAPISSWATAVGSIIADSGVENGLQVFLQTIPFNFYAILTIIMVIFISSSKNMDFGPMKKAELDCLNNGTISDIDANSSLESSSEIKTSSKGRVFDLCIPIGFLIITTLFYMLYNGGFFSENISFSSAIANADVNVSLVVGAFCALLLSFFLFVPRKLISYKDFMKGIGDGVKSMVPAFIILILAWTMSAVCRELLDTGGFVGHLVQSNNIPMNIFPAIIFIISAVLAFAMGTSWGTFSILIPIVIELSYISNGELLIVLLSATLGGAVLGDHCSPISDTTILASAGAKCDHIKHVSTQIVYAVIVGGCCVIGYIVAGFTNNLLLSFGSSLICLISFFVFMKFRNKTKKLK